MKHYGLGARLRRCGITQKELAARLGVTVGAVAQGVKDDGRWHYRAIVARLND